jgi:hypothetical protein
LYVIFEAVWTLEASHEGFPLVDEQKSPVAVLQRHSCAKKPDRNECQENQTGRVKAAVWRLAGRHLGHVGSMFMDISSELIHSLLPVFMATTLGVSVVTIGVIEGVAEATASITKVFSGALSDFLRKRKLLMLLGYGLAALTKPVFPLASSVGWVFGARFVDRIGKGIRGAPRDALVADIAAPELRGAAYGLRQALTGGCTGPVLAVLAMAWFADNIRSAPGSQFSSSSLYDPVVCQGARARDGWRRRKATSQAGGRKLLPKRYY